MKTKIIRNIGSRKTSSSSNSDSENQNITLYTSRSDSKIKLAPIQKNLQPLQTLREESEPNTPGTPAEQARALIKSSRKSRFHAPPVMEDSSSDGSEHEVWDNDDLLLKGIHLGEFSHLSQTDELQLLYKIRYETHPNYREEISNSEVAQNTQQLMKKIKFHFFKYKPLLPLNNENNYHQPYSLSNDENYMRFWHYFLNKRNHRRHKQAIPIRSKNSTQSFILKSESINPMVRNAKKIQTQYRIRSLASRR